MREGQTNSGKKEQRQFNQLLDKSVKEGREKVRDTHGRTTPKQHALKGRRAK